MELSIIIPVYNESDSILTLKKEISSIVFKEKLSTEIIFIDDGSTDGSWEIIRKISKKHNKYLCVRGINFGINSGKSAALNEGFMHAQGEVVITMDGDLQDDPIEIPNFYYAISSDKFDLVSGWKKKRKDPLSKTILTKIYNWATRVLSGISLHDFNCGFKAYKREVIKNIIVSGEMHRYIPVLAAQQGFTKISEKVVKHQARKYGKTKFGNDRFYKGFLDLITLWFIQKFGKRPMHFFGVWGTIMLILGFGFILYTGFDKLYLDTSGRLITERPQFFIALTLMLLGSQFFIAGFLGEIILKTQKRTKNYSIAETI